MHLHLKLVSGKTTVQWAYPAEDPESASIKLTPVPFEAVTGDLAPLRGGVCGLQSKS